MKKIKVFVLAFILPLMMVACAADDTSSTGGSLTLGVPVSGNVIEDDVVVYTLSVNNGTSYDIELLTASGDADLEVCKQPNSVDCPYIININQISINQELESLTMVADFTGTLYINVEGWDTSSYVLGVVVTPTP